MPLVIKDAEGEERTPHLALTHSTLQGGSANKRNVSLLMKSEATLSEKVMKALKSLGLVPDEEQELIDKAAFYSQQQRALQSAVKDKYGDEDSWLYVEDFDDSVVIFCNGDGVWSATYSLVNGAITLSDLANPVQQVINYEPKSGDMLLSEDAEDKLEEGVYGLVTKALQNSETKEHFAEMFKCLQTKKETEVIKLEEEIKKAVADAEVLFKAQLGEQAVLLQKALDDVAAYQAQAKEAVTKARKEAVALVEKDADKAEALEKALEALSQEAFDVVIKSMQAKDAVVEESDLFVQKSKNVEVEDVVQESVEMQLLKAKYAPK
jgi:hypothetical protein